jgi:phospholipid/cholesterol/gamma-HCH transport system permease protein
MAVPVITAPVRLFVTPFRTVGRGVATGMANLGSFLLFSFRAIRHAITDVILRGQFRDQVVKHMSDIVIGAGAWVMGAGMIFVVFAMAFMGGATVGLQGFKGLQSIGAEPFVGLVGSFANTREITPIIAGVAIASQVGASFTAELGAQRISDEIDALEVMATSSLTYLVSTRLVAISIVLVPLYLLALFASFFGTRLITTQLFGLSTGVYDYYFSIYLPAIDIFYSLIKASIFAVVICLVHCYYGYYASGGPVGVGIGVGRAIRMSIIVVVVINLLLSFLLWGSRGTVSLTG